MRAGSTMFASIMCAGVTQVRQPVAESSVRMAGAEMSSGAGSGARLGLVPAVPHAVLLGTSVNTVRWVSMSAG